MNEIGGTNYLIPPFYTNNITFKKLLYMKKIIQNALYFMAQIYMKENMLKNKFLENFAFQVIVKVEQIKSTENRNVCI